jgi:hypothetical protein
MILLLYEYLANLFGHRLFSKRFTVPNAIAIIANGFVSSIEIVPEHLCARVLICQLRSFCCVEQTEYT